LIAKRPQIEVTFLDLLQHQIPFPTLEL